MKVAINRAYGGFSLSDQGTERYCELKGIPFDEWNCRGVERDDPLLIQVIEELGEAADGQWADLAIVNVPDDVKWTIEEYDGKEWVAEQHRTWG